MKPLLSSLTAAVLFAAATVQAAPEAQVIRLSGDGEALIVPASSPARFQSLGRDLDAHFSGRFVLSGTFTYGCEYDCDGPVKESDMALYVYPDAAMAARLPHWTQHTNDIRIGINNPIPLVRTILSSQTRAALMNGKLNRVTGHLEIVVSEFMTTIECDSANYSAHFVAVAKPATIRVARLDGTYGCG